MDQFFGVGSIGFFGSITDYVYRQTFDDSVLFSPEGKVLDRNFDFRKVDKTQCYLKIGNKVIEGGLFAID